MSDLYHGEYPVDLTPNEARALCERMEAQAKATEETQRRIMNTMTNPEEQIISDERAKVMDDKLNVERLRALGEDFLTQLRRINTERYDVWASRPLMLCTHCGRDENGAAASGHNMCSPPFSAVEHEFTRPHPHITVSNDAGIMFDALELGGEVGELLNVVKKMEREERGWRGSRVAPEDFADECADVLICLDKLARRRGIDLAEVTARKFNATSDKVGLPHKLSHDRAAILAITKDDKAAAARYLAGTAFGMSVKDYLSAWEEAENSEDGYCHPLWIVLRDHRLAASHPAVESESADRGAELCQSEIEVLRILNGENVPGWCWGAAMSECCSALVEHGFARPAYEITQAGKDYLAAIDGETT